MTSGPDDPGGEPSGGGERAPEEPAAGVDVRLGPGGEFDLIRRFLAGDPGPLPAGVRVGPGDDAAVVGDEGIVVGTDMVVEDVHFRRAWLGPEEVGRRAAGAALSDLAAMAARPLGILVSVALAPGDAGDYGAALARGAAGAAREVDAALLGGDTTRSPGPVVVDVVAVGVAPEPLLREGARPGDEVWVTGELGGAAAALRALEEGRVPPARARSRLARPRPRIREALWLVGATELRAGIDLSDGLAGDAGHLAAAGGVQVLLEEARIPVDPVARAVAPEEALHLALAGGEDYELCVVAAPGRLQAVAGEFRTRFRLSLTRVGRIREGEGVWLAPEAGAAAPLEAGGWDHFAGGGP